MKLNKVKNFFTGASVDSLFLIMVRVVTLVLGMLMTRLLSGHFSLHEYGTYSQVLLLTSTVSSLTILGMMDGINFFFSRERNTEKRNAYVSTIFFLQYIASAIASAIVLSCAIPISNYFENIDLKKLIVFAAILPILQNAISLLQIMFVAIGKAKIIAFRNLAVSIAKLIAITLACYVFNSIIVLLVAQVLLDLAQAVYFAVSLQRNNCKISVFSCDKKLIKEILVYCVPMAMFSMIKSLNRDVDKFVISFFTNTETLAVYTNASKLLPFDIVMTSFCTVLLPYITCYFSENRRDYAKKLYRSFLELSYTVTTILAGGAICIAPELMRFLYTETYTSYEYGIAVFVIYITVDIFSVMNMTMVLSAAGKTKTIMLASIGIFFVNVALDIGLYFVLQEVGPAFATLVVTMIQGLILFSLTAKELGTNLLGILDCRNLCIFIAELVLVFFVSLTIRYFMLKMGFQYVLILFVVYVFFCGTMFLLNYKKIFENLKKINQSKLLQTTL